MSKNSFVKTSAEILVMFPAGTPQSVLDTILMGHTWESADIFHDGSNCWSTMDNSIQIIIFEEDGIIVIVPGFTFCSETNIWQEGYL